MNNEVILAHQQALCDCYDFLEIDLLLQFLSSAANEDDLLARDCHPSLLGYEADPTSFLLDNSGEDNFLLRVNKGLLYCFIVLQIKRILDRNILNTVDLYEA